MGVVYANLNLPEQAFPALGKAYQLRDRVSQREKFYIESHYYDLVTGEYDKAAQIYQLWQQTYPDDAAPRGNLGTLYSFLGQHERNVEEQLQVLHIDPTLSVGYSNLANAYLCLNQIDKAKAVLAEAEALKIENPGFWEVRYEIAFLSGDAERLEHEFGVSMSQGQEGVLALQADTEAYYGHLRKARELTRRAIQLARRHGDLESAIGYQVVGALRETEFGNSTLARRQVVAALASVPDENSRALGALVLARTGAAASARAVAQDISRRLPSNILVNDYWVPTILAAAESDEDPQRAIGILDAAMPYELGLPTTPTNAVPYPIYIRGLAFLAAGQGTKAAEEFQKILDHPGIVGNYPLGALAHLGQARAYALQAHVLTKATDKPHHKRRAPSTGPAAEMLASASNAYHDFLTLWKDADPDIPILRQARTEFENMLSYRPDSKTCGSLPGPASSQAKNDPIVGVGAAGPR
jgi:tetratricopeptide (TPR) repeat protein